MPIRLPVLTAWIALSFTALFPHQGSLGAQSPRKPEGVLLIRQLDVGQGDAALITTPERKRILIDAGPNDNVVGMLIQEGVDTIDLVIASHNHADHIGGMAAVLDAFVVRTYLDNGIPHNTATYTRTRNAIENEPGIVYLEAFERTINVGSVKVRILPPPHANSSHNDNSVGVLVQFGEFDALFTGDSEQEELGRWLADARVPHVEMLKAAHHGSWNGATPEWVLATSPSIVVISVSATNGFGHPSPDIERIWAAAKARVYRTDRDGTIQVTVRADGQFSVQNWSPASASKP